MVKPTKAKPRHAVAAPPNNEMASRLARARVASRAARAALALARANEAAVAAGDDADERWITIATVCAIHGGVSPMTVWRWMARLNFPQPERRIGGRRYWKYRKVMDWRPPRTAAEDRRVGAAR